VDRAEREAGTLVFTVNSTGRSFEGSARVGAKPAHGIAGSSSAVALRLSRDATSTFSEVSVSPSRESVNVLVDAPGAQPSDSQRRPPNANQLALLSSSTLPLSTMTDPSGPAILKD